MAQNTLFSDSIQLAGYLGHEAARVALGLEAPDGFTLDSMIRGGDRRWRAAMRALGHVAAGTAACSLADLALGAYLAAPDSGPEVTALARAAVASLGRWRESPDSAQARAAVRESGLGFYLAVEVGGPLYGAAGERGRRLGRVVGKCASVVLDHENPRHVRSLGEAASGVSDFPGVSEDAVRRAVASAMLPFALRTANQG
jgi:hypothetical protein